MCIKPIPGTSGFLFGWIVFLVLYLNARHNLRKRTATTFEPRGEGSFEPLLAHYTKIAETIAGLAGGAIVFLAGSTVIGNRDTGRNLARLPWTFASPLVLLGLSIIFAVVFIGLLTYFYEGFLHKQPYTNNRYALIIAFGFAALFCFAGGLIWLGFVIATAL